VAFGLPRKQRRARSRVLDLLDLVGLDRTFAGRYPHQLSGGQQQRVALARALAPGPSLILLDEPFAALDAQLRLQTGAAVVAALRATEATAILVTHDQSEALSLTDSVAVMRSGRIVQVGTPANVYAAPTDLEVARFVGDAVVLPATVHAGMAVCPLGELPVAGATVGPDVPACVLVRPEQLELGTDGVMAFVEDVTFFGPDALVALTLAGGAHRLAARVQGSAVPARGATVHVGVRGPVRAYADPERPAGSFDVGGSELQADRVGGQ
jgi:iron(III) transport system ATP-binding protein